MVPRGDLALNRCCLVSLACVANITFHLWLTTLFDGKTIITAEALQYVPPGVCDILLLVKENTSAIYAHNLLSSGKYRIQMIQQNIRQHCLSPISSTIYNFEVSIAHRYPDRLLDGLHSTYSTGEENHLFTAYGLTPLNNSA
jgi:hypothetical protein